MLRFLDGTEDNPLAHGKQLTHLRVLASAGRNDVRCPPYAFADRHLLENEAIGGTELEDFGGQIGPGRQSNNRWSGTG